MSTLPISCLWIWQASCINRPPMPQLLYLSRTANHGMNIGVEGLLMSSFSMRLAKTVCPFWSGKPWYSDLDFQSCWGFIFCTLPSISSRVIIYFMGAQHFAPYHTYAYSYYGRIPFRSLVPEPQQGPPSVWRIRYRNTLDLDYVEPFGTLFRHGDNFVSPPFKYRLQTMV